VLKIEMKILYQFTDKWIS